MISWVRCVLGQIQEEEQATATAEPIESLLESDAPPAAKAPDASRSDTMSWIAGGLAVLAAVIGFLVWTQLNQQIERAEHLERQLSVAEANAARLLAQNQELMEQVKALREERDLIDRRVAALGLQLSAAATELDQTKGRLMAFQRLSQQLQEAQAGLQIEKTGHEAARQQIKRLADEKAQLRRTMSRLRYQFELLDREYRGVISQVTAVQATANPDVRMVSQTSSTPAVVAATPMPPRSRAAASAETTSIITPAMTEAMSRLSSLSSTSAVQLQPVVVHQGGAGAATPLSAQLLHVDEPHQFIVLNVGRLAGVWEGMTFDIVREGAHVGQADVVSVHPRVTACRITGTDTSDSLRVGDVAIQAPSAGRGSGDQRS